MTEIGTYHKHGDIMIKGWVERDGQKLSTQEVENLLINTPESITHCGGEFYISGKSCKARDYLGIVQGDCPKGTLQCRGTQQFLIDPDIPDLPLDKAIVAAVQLRNDEGVTALSGGIDSTLVAYLAQRECVAVGMKDSHDLDRASAVSQKLGLSCTCVQIVPQEIESALPVVLGIIPQKDPVNTAIALTQYFIARWAGEQGFERILTGQGADELFGGYSRYLTTKSLEEDLTRDFCGLELQAQRDQAVAALYGTYLSMPYLDLRVVRAAQKIPAEKKVSDGKRKIPLREVAEQFIPADIAWYEKKAMQYGSGVAKELQRLARHNGYKTSLQGYLDRIIREEHDH